MEHIKKLLKNWKFLAGLVLVVAISWTWTSSRMGSPEDTGVNSSPSPSAQVSGSVKPNGTQPGKNAPRLISISPAAGKAGAPITIKGSGFSSTGNTITFTAKNKNTHPWYILKAIGFPSSEQGTVITMGITPSSFIYGECRTSDTFCNSRAQKLEPGEYTVTVQAANCPPASCTSNGLQFIVVQ